MHESTDSIPRFPEILHDVVIMQATANVALEQPPEAPSESVIDKKVD